MDASKKIIDFVVIKKEQPAEGPTGRELLNESFIFNIEEGLPIDAQTLLSANDFPPQKPKQRHLYESPEARGRRLARNAERMRERRSNETEEQYRFRLHRTAEKNRLRRQQENDLERTMRHVRDAARQRIRRAMESPEQRAKRLAKLAAHSRMLREMESPEQKAIRLQKLAAHHRKRYAQQQEAKKLQKQNNSFNQSNHNSAATDKITATTTATSNHRLTISTKPYKESRSSTSSSSNASSTDLKTTTQFTTMYSPPPSAHEILYYRSGNFTELPPHLAPNQPKYYGSVPNFVPTTPTTVQYLPSSHQQVHHHQHQPPPPSSHLNIVRPNQSTLNAVITIPVVPNVHSNQQHHSQQQHQHNPVVQLPTPVRGRPVKIFPSNDYQSIGPTFREEAERQQRVNDLLEEQINIMLLHPKQERGRPSLSAGQEMTTEREMRLRKMAEARRNQRDRETPDERQARLKDLADRARRRREIMLATETEAERKDRLAKQAEYARQRRFKTQTPEAIRMASHKAKSLYTKIHDG